MIERGFAAVASDIADIKSTMATKDDIAAVNKTLADHTKILNDHTRDLAIIKHDVTNNLDKRLQLTTTHDFSTPSNHWAPRVEVYFRECLSPS